LKIISIGCLRPDLIIPISGENENFGPNNVSFGSKLNLTSISPLFSKYAFVKKNIHVII